MKITSNISINSAILFGLALSLVSATALAETIRWYQIEFPPISWQSGPLAGRGINDEVLKVIIEDWREDEHVVTFANPKRIWADIAAGKEVCYPSVLRNAEREKIAYLTDKQLTPPVQLLVRSELLHKLPRSATGSVLFGQLLKDSSIQGLVADGRSYGSGLDALIAARPENSGLKLSNSSTGGANLFRMLALKRADYTIDFDIVLTYEK